MEYTHTEINKRCLISKDEATYKLLIGLFILCFIYSNTIRVMLKVNTNIDVRFSIITSILFIGIFLVNSKKINFINLNIFFLIGILQICSAIYFKTSITSIYAFVNTIWIPLILMTIKVKKEIMIKLFEKFVNLYNILIIILTITIIIDYITSGSIQLFMAKFLDGTTYQRVIVFEQNSGIYRAHTLLGHALTTAYYYLIFLGINMSYLSYFKKNSNIKKNNVILISIVGLFLSNSKFALMLSTILFFLNIKNSKHKLIYVCGIIFIGAILINTDYFHENIIARFNQAIELGDITNGRLTALNTFLESNNKFNFILGHGMWSSDNLLEYLGTNNFEMPILMFAYDYGILSTVLIIYIIYIYPNIVFIKNKSYYMAIVFNILFLFGNSYNGFAVGLTTFQMFSIITFILINISKSNNLSLN